MTSEGLPLSIEARIVSAAVGDFRPASTSGQSAASPRMTKGCPASHSPVNSSGVGAAYSGKGSIGTQ